jgi:hypothetical protein
MTPYKALQQQKALHRFWMILHGDYLGYWADQDNIRIVKRWLKRKPVIYEQQALGIHLPR